MNEKEVLDYIHKRQRQSRKSPMGIYTPSDCKLPNLKIEPLMILHAPRIIRDLGVVYGWLWSRGILKKTRDLYDRERLYAERGAISELAIDVIFRSIYVSSVEWSGLFNFADYDFIREGNKPITIGITSSRQGDMETYTIRQATGANLKGNPAIQYSYKKIDKPADYLIGVSVKSTTGGSDIAIWGAITKRRLRTLMKKLYAKGFGLITGNDVWLPLKVNEIKLKGFSRRDFTRLLTALGCNEDLQLIEDKTNAELKAIADRSAEYYASRKAI
jgi:hypothetical protein